LVIAVDTPQGIGDKGYEGRGLERHLLPEELTARSGHALERFEFDASYRCPQPILDLASAIYAQGQSFFSRVRVPTALHSKAVSERGGKPTIFAYPGREAMLDAIPTLGGDLCAQLGCKRSDILIVPLVSRLEEALPQRVLSLSKVLQKRSDAEQERAARRANHFVIAKPEYLHGLEYEAVILLGLTSGDVPSLQGGVAAQGAAAVFATQRTVDLLYLAITRAKQAVVALCDREPSFLVKSAIDSGVASLIHVAR
jgi:hypothetical protein